MPSSTWARPGGKPAILCLHGGGTTGDIFHIQTIRLRRELSDKFDFVFVDAPFERVAGPNVLPVFEGAGPFLGWVDLRDPKNCVAHPSCVDVINRAIDDQIKKTGKHFVGVMGFSEGARLAAGIALHQQQERKLKCDSSISNDEENGFLFAILLNATYPTLNLTPPPSLISSLISTPPRITLPAIITVGATDPWREDTRSLAANVWDRRHVKTLEFNTGHHLPVQKVDTLRLSNEITNLYYRIIDNFDNY